MKPTVDQLAVTFRKVWRADTAFDSNTWSDRNPARGQCVVTALVAQEYLGGDLQRYEVTGDVEETHYANKLDSGTIVDFTASQYEGFEVHSTPTETDLRGFASIRDKRLADRDTRERYNVLRERVDRILQEKNDAI